MKKILVIGSINMDYVMNVKNMPKVGETILSDNMELIAGGKGANQAFAAGKLGGNVSMLGAIGNDGNGKAVKASLDSVNVDTSKLKVCEDSPTGIAIICINSDGDNSIIVSSGANMRVFNDYIDENISLIKECDIVVMQLEIPLDTVIYVLKKAKEYGKFVILDPAPAIADLPEEIIKNVDIIKPNETELAILAGDENLNLDEALSRLEEKGAKTIIATLGGDGAVLYQNGKSTHFKADKNVKVVDTTAAGDSFTAAIALGLAKEMTLEQAIVFAGKVSEIVVGRKGAQTSIPTLEEVLANT